MVSFVEAAFDAFAVKRRPAAPAPRSSHRRLSHGRRTQRRLSHRRLSYRRAFAIWATASVSLWGLGYVVLAKFGVL